jgi:hypothetical protein
MTYTLSSYCFLRRLTTFLGPRRRCSSPMTQRGTLSSEAFVSFESSTAPGQILKSLSAESGACSLRTFFIRSHSLLTRYCARASSDGALLVFILLKGTKTRSELQTAIKRHCVVSKDIPLEPISDSLLCHLHIAKISFSFPEVHWLVQAGCMFHLPPAAYRSCQFCA